MPTQVVRAPQEPLDDLDPVVRELNRFAARVDEEERPEKGVSIVSRNDPQKGRAAKPVEIRLFAKRNRRYVSPSGSGSLAPSGAISSSGSSE